MKAKRIHTSVAASLILVTLLNGCVPPGGGVGGDNRHASTRAVATYKPPFLPIEVAYDLLNDKLSVYISNKIQSPLGTIGFSAGVTVEEDEKKYEGIRVLRIEAGDKIYIYNLEKGRPYRITIPTDFYGKTELRLTGEDENITVSIPHPTAETVAELKERLRLLESQRASQRVGREPQSTSGAQGSDAPARDESTPNEKIKDAPSSSSTSGPEPPPASEPVRTASRIYKGGEDDECEAEIGEPEAGVFPFKLSTPRCSRAATGRANWTTQGLAYSISPIREDAVAVENAAPNESMCRLSFTFSGDELTVGEVGQNCHCNYVGVYSLK